MLFKLSLDQRNLDEAVDMGEGERCTRFTRYEPQIYHKTGKTKYTIVSIHLTALVSGLLLPQQTECLIANRFVNAQGGANNKNIAFDEYAQCRKQNCMKVALQDGKHPQAFKRISSSCRMTKLVEKSAVQVNGKVSTICHHTNLMCNMS